MSHRPPLWFRALRYLPRDVLSRLAGRLARLRWPGPIQRRINIGFGRVVGVDFGEVRDPLAAFPTLQAFFTRALIEGARPIDPAPDALVSPCDGQWGASGEVRGGELLQLKGRPYALADLVGSAEDAEVFEGGQFATLYLSPRDYHRFHAPCDAQVTRARYLPGSLWPVNRVGLEGVQGLFARNERICAFLRRADWELALVAVGATMVGSIRVCFDDLVTNRRGGRRSERHYTDLWLAKGEEWGRFEFGSTIVLLVPPAAGRLDLQPDGAPLRLGCRIGTLATS